MSMRLNKNMFSLNIYRTYSNSVDKSNKLINNLSSGLKLNSAKDNPNKYGQSENLKISILSNKRAEQNIQDTNSMIQTFDGAMQEVNDTLARIKELTVQGGNGNLSAQDKQSVQNEIDELIESLDDLANNTEFNGIKISDSTASGLNPNFKTALVGAMDDETIDLPFFNISSENLGVANLDVNNTDKSLEDIDNAINMVSRIRGNYGALQNNLDETAEIVSERNLKLDSAQSDLADADIAKEYLEYSTQQILIQASTGLIAQANNIPQESLEILRNIR